MKNYIKNIKHPEYFQGLRKDNYFEGWYFKFMTGNNDIISFIPGISTNSNDKHAFIQVINNITNDTYYIRYDSSEFKTSENPFCVHVGKSMFSMDKVILDIEDSSLTIQGEIVLSNLTPIKKSLYAPTIMGPFAYLPFLECYHGVLSLHHNLSGTLMINSTSFPFDKGVGYIEKDWGTSFPEEYIWVQSNNTKSKDTFFLSVASIPFLKLNFTGLLCILFIDNREYRFSTYNFSKIMKIEKVDNEYYIELRKGRYLLTLTVILNDSQVLYSPDDGSMHNTIKESLNSKGVVKLYFKSKKIYEEILDPCLAEVEWNHFQD